MGSSTIFTLLMIAIMIACVLLVAIIMAQNPKGGGLSGTFGGASSSTFGVQRTNDFMEKATWVLGIMVTVLIFLSVVLTAKPSSVASKKEMNKTEKKTTPATPSGITK